jgi:D-xylose transport system permease protein
VRGGELGSIPALVGLIVVTGVFAVVHQGFLSAYNIEALVIQAAPIIVMAMGLIFVLLGEIDLSAGTTGGLCSAIMAVLILRHGASWWLAIMIGLIAGVLIGLGMDWLRARVVVPSFVITLATFLAFQGVTLILIGSQGSVNLPNNSPLIKLEKQFRTAVARVGSAGAVRHRVRRDQAERRAPIPPRRTLSRAVHGDRGEGRRAGGARCCVHARVGYQPQPDDQRLLRQQGAGHAVGRRPAGGPVRGVELGPQSHDVRPARVRRWSQRGAARRAGVVVARIRISVFVICSGMSAASGMVAASLLQSVQSNAGAGNTLLLAVGAAVIGGTSLFGGHGRVLDAVVGGLVVAVIINGMCNLIQGANSSGYEYVVTGAVLLLAAGFDAVVRRRRAVRAG